MEPILLVHGGAGFINDDRKATELLLGVKEAAKAGYKVLKSKNSLLDGLEEAVRVMEDNEIFNAGLGSVLNLDGEVEMDASIMLGSNLNAGGVTVVKNIKNPISLARRVMEKTPHFLLAGEGALKFAKREGFEILSDGALVTEARKLMLENYKKKLAEKKLTNTGEAELGTVGAVAFLNGQVAAATSTGGYEGKMVGRCSDTSIIGSGTYADDESGAVSTTGHGDSIAKVCLAHDICKEMEAGKSAQEATEICVNKMLKRLENTAGAITLSVKGEIGIAFSSNRMSWAYQIGNMLHFGINKNEHNVEIVN
ncbi:isoaspartyl peptidase/L-asparaginase [Onthophagus taurus]|uniref:isoaspartyl peptidase/L-asparaginase n=1 Tax=Onthophagus taurus TaxID=166361 RepID=UPI000C208550|nr:isoaspartyl peptidase/L-asparaginase [Onthophagus taurus]